ncbi:MAG TPA: hypothetical protein VG737_15310 [Cyclobacteriaceae bacterium]|nr:hypothetical protein [Cyclobacteriaceae bacterium]
MKKAVALVVIAASILLSACSQYTCPTYSKAAPAKAPIKISAVSEARI